MRGPHLPASFQRPLAPVLPLIGQQARDLANRPEPVVMATRHANKAGVGGSRLAGRWRGRQDGAEPVWPGSANGQLERRHLPGGGMQVWPARPAHCSEIPAPPQVPRPGPPVSPSRRPIPLTSHLALNAPGSSPAVPQTQVSHPSTLSTGLLVSQTPCLPLRPEPHQLPSILTDLRVSEAEVREEEAGSTWRHYPPPPPHTHTLLGVPVVSLSLTLRSDKARTNTHPSS